MADQNTSLPIRTVTAGDVDINISDAVTPSQKLVVNADGSIDTNFAAGSKIIITDGVEDLLVNADGSINTNFPAGTQIEITDGTETLLVNADGSINAVVTATALDIRPLTNADVVTVEDGGGSLTVDGTVAATQSGTWDIGTVTTLTGITNDVNIADGGNSITVDAVDLDIRDLDAATDSVQANLFDETGTAFSGTNPLPVEMVSDQAGDEVCDYNTTAAVAKDASTNHDYVVTAAKTLLAESVWASGSGKMKVEVLSNGTTIFVGFNSTANPNIDIPIKKICKTAATQTFRITITNLDNQAQDLYSTLTGLEV